MQQHKRGNPIRLLRREWRDQFSAKSAKCCPNFDRSVHQPITLWQSPERVVERVAQMMAKAACRAILALDSRFCSVYIVE